MQARHLSMLSLRQWKRNRDQLSNKRRLLFNEEIWIASKEQDINHFSSTTLTANVFSLYSQLNSAIQMLMIINNDALPIAQDQSISIFEWLKDC